MGSAIMTWILGRARDLRFPYLFLLIAALFVADLFLPDAIPFADELLLGLLTLLLGNWRKHRNQREEGTSLPAASAGDHSSGEDPSAGDRPDN